MTFSKPQQCLDPTRRVAASSLLLPSSTGPWLHHRSLLQPLSSASGWQCLEQRKKLLLALVVPETSFHLVAQPCAGAVHGYRKCQWACPLCDGASLEFPIPRLLYLLCCCQNSNLLCCGQDSREPQLCMTNHSRQLEKEVCWVSKTTACEKPRCMPRARNENDS